MSKTQQIKWSILQTSILTIFEMHLNVGMSVAEGAVRKWKDNRQLYYRSNVSRNLP